MSKGRVEGRTRSWGMSTLLLLAAAWVAPLPLYAQDGPDSELRFYELLDDEGLGLDEARDVVAEEFDEYEAAEIAAYLCAPDPDEACEDSEAWKAWGIFLDRLAEGWAIGEIVNDISEWDEDLAIAIAIYWCSPPAGYGCDEYTDDERESAFEWEDEVKDRPQSGEYGAQFFGGGKKRHSRTRGSRAG